MNLLRGKKHKNQNNIHFYPSKSLEVYNASRNVYKGWCTTFQAAMNVTIIIGQCFGLNPVSGVTENDSSKLRFRLCSWRCIYSIVSILGQSFVVCTNFVKFIHADSSIESNSDGGQQQPRQRRHVASTNSSGWVPAGVSPHELIGGGSTQSRHAVARQAKFKPTEPPRASPLMYTYTYRVRPRYEYMTMSRYQSFIADTASHLYIVIKTVDGHDAFLVFSTTNCVTTILFLRLSTKWPRLCQYISKTEAVDPNLDSNLVRRCNVSCIVILILAFTEHLLADLTSFSLVLDCNKEALYEGFITQNFPMLFSIIPYNTFFAILSQIINIQCVFNWNFADVFVICISLYLTSRFQQVNRRIAAVKEKNASPMSWRILREDYTRVANLVRRIDDVIGGIVFISFANNVFFICLQLLHTLGDGISATPRCYEEGPDRRPLKGYEHAVYFVFSLVFLVTRSLAVSLIASRVHTVSKEPANALYDVSSGAYCTETQRFLSQVQGDTIALTGIHCFKVTRGIVLTIAGTIVTYELVLMQFTGVTPTSSPV